MVKHSANILPLPLQAWHHASRLDFVDLHQVGKAGYRKLLRNLLETSAMVQSLPEFCIQVIIRGNHNESLYKLQLFALSVQYFESRTWSSVNPFCPEMWLILKKEVEIQRQRQHAAFRHALWTFILPQRDRSDP